MPIRRNFLSSGHPKHGNGENYSPSLQGSDDNASSDLFVKSENRSGCGMKLVIHAGLHKTATTTFQTFCRMNNARLKEFGILFPVIDFDPGNAHNPLAHLMTEGRRDEVREYLSRFYSEAERSGANLLLSGEHFETLLVDSEMGHDFDRIARGCGFDEVVWYFVLRDPWQYFNSLYGELAKRGVCTEYDLMAHEILNFGSFSCGNVRRKWKFSFSYRRHIAGLAARVDGPIKSCSMDAFLNNGPGAPLFSEILGDPRAAARLLKDSTLPDRKINARLKAEVIEVLYLCTFLGLSHKYLRLKRMIFLPLVLHRSKRVHSYKAGLKASFEAKWGDWAKTVGIEDK